MNATNVETILSAYEAFNRGQLHEVVEGFREDVTWNDHALGATMKSREEFVGWLSDRLAAWKQAFPDGSVTDVRAIDAGDAVTIEAVFRGTNDGPFQGHPPTGKRISLPACEVWRFDEEGQVLSGATYYDRLSLLIQLGHVEI